MKKVLLLDLDDTLINSTESYAFGQKAAFKYIKKLVPRLTETRFNKLYQQAKEQTHKQLKHTASSHNRLLYFQKIFETLKLSPNPKQLDEIEDLFWKEANKKLKLYPNVKETLLAIKKHGLKICLVSDLTAEVQMEKLRKLRLNNLIDFIVTSEEAGADKPDPRNFKLALKKSQTKPNEAIMLGDDYVKDILGAKKAGIEGVYCGSKPAPKADYQIQSFKELLPIILRSNSGFDEGYVKFNYTWKKGSPRFGEAGKPLNAKLIQELNKVRTELYKLKLIGAYANGVGYGNISLRYKKGFIISGTETGNFKNLANRHYTFVSNWNFDKNHLTCTGPIVASSESLTHAAVYKADKTAQAVIHIHSPKMWQKLVNKIPTTRANVPYGTVAMTKEIKRLFKENKQREKPAKGWSASGGILIMGGHKPGLLAFGKNLNEAEKMIKDYAR